MPLPAVAARAESMNEAQLLADFVGAGSQEAFAALVQCHSPMVLAVCRRILGNADADDAAQAVFVLLWQKAKQLPKDAVIAGWLHRTAQHVCRNAMRSRNSRTRHERNAAAELTTMSNTSPDSAHWSEISQILDEEVNRLPDKLRLPFVLFHLENHSLAEVATIIGSTVPTVGTWLQRAREQLAGRLRRRGIAVGAAALAALLAQHAVAQAAPAAFVAATVQTAAGFAAGGAVKSAAIATLVKSGAAGGVATKVWIVTGVAAALLIGYPLAIFWFLPMMQTRQSPDFPLLQGAWHEIAHEQHGGPVNAQPPVKYVGSLVISGRSFHRFQTLASGQVIEGEQGTFVLDDARRPRSIDFKLWQGAARGVYEFDGDTLTLCVTTNGGPRPDAFLTAPNDGRTLTRYERAK